MRLSLLLLTVIFFVQNSFANSLPSSRLENLGSENLAAAANAPLPQSDRQDPSHNTAFLAQSTQHSPTPLAAISPDTLKKFVAVIDLVRKNYADNVDDNALFNGAMAGVLASLDGHASLLDAKAFNNLKAYTEGATGSVGIVAAFDNQANYWTIVALDDEAATAGLAIGDYLHQIGDKKLTNLLGEHDIKQLLSGIAGTQVTVVASKQGRQKKSFVLTRNKLANDGLNVSLDGDLAIVKIPSFTEHTRDELIEKLVQISQPIKGIVLDVKDNPGGVLTEAIAVAGLFVDEKNVAAMEFAPQSGKPKKVLKTGKAPLKQMPVMVLQNRYSASAAEVLALALKQSPNAFIVGETSYGKGSVQSVFSLGDDEAIKLTTAHYTDVNGHKIDGVGVAADVPFDFDKESMEAALALLRARQLPVGMLMALPLDY